MTEDVLFTADDVADALRECRAAAYERGMSAGRAEASRMLEFAVRLNGHGPSIVKALQEATEPPDAEPSRDEIAVLAAIDALIEAKTHGAESGSLYRQIAGMIGGGEALEGGLADDLPDSEFDPEQLATGVAVEMEHTDDEEEATEIAKDHLTEDADYYRKLANVEGGTISKAFDSSKHPRGDDGRFIGRESINAAKSDPALAEKLREKTTDPEERKKLDAALKGESDLGRTKAGLHRDKVAASKKEKADRVARVRDLADEISMARRGGEPVSAEHFRALVADLPHLTIKDLRSVRLKLAASFFGRTKREDLVTALVHQAKMRAEQMEYDARHAEDDPLDFGMDAMASVADRPSDRRQEDANPWHKLDKQNASAYGEAQHGGAMYQRHMMDREHGVKDTVAYNTNGPDVKPYWLDLAGKPVDVITPAIANRKEASVTPQPEAMAPQVEPITPPTAASDQPQEAKPRKSPRKKKGQ